MSYSILLLTQEQAEALRRYNKQSVSWLMVLSGLELWQQLMVQTLKTLLQSFQTLGQTYQGIVARRPDQARFIRGWLNRTEDARKLGLSDQDSKNTQA